MELKRLLPPHHIIINLDGNSPEEIIRKLSQPLLQDGNITDLELFVQSVLEREKIYTTQIMDEVAFPHAHASQVKCPSLVIGLAPEGLAFVPNTPGKCKLFFLMAVPAYEPEAHLELMANLVDFVMSDKLESALLAKSPEEILDLIEKH